MVSGDDRKDVQPPCELPTITRRDLFHNASLAMAAVALPSLTAMHGQPNGAQADAPKDKSSVMPPLSAYLSGAREKTMPDEAIELTKEHLLDTFAAMISGSELDPGKAALRFARAYPGERVATVVASSMVCGPIEAAFVNGMLAHSDETDDSHNLSHSHPGCAVVPAALAAGENFSISGTQMLRAVALGYDIGTRITMAMGGERYENESHRSTHSIATYFGAAAAAGSAANLNAQQMRWLLSYTAQSCSGLTAWRRDTEHIQKAFAFAGMTARSGVTAALIVQSGWTGVDDIFSGKDNFFLAYAPGADTSVLVDGLGERYEVTRTDIKKWTVGSPIQAVLDALVLLREKHPFTVGQVRQVTATLAPSEATTVNNRDIPDICVQHMIAVMLVDGTVTFKSAHDPSRMKDTAVLQERAKVKLVPDEAFEKYLPTRAALVEVTLTDGTQLSQLVEAVRGTTKNPMGRDEVVAKARDLITPVLGVSACNGLIEKTLSIEALNDVKDLRPLLQRAEPS
jgi:2-methylcitrate dehydratase PrpD